MQKSQVGHAAQLDQGFLRGRGLRGRGAGLRLGQGGQIRLEGFLLLGGQPRAKDEIAVRRLALHSTLTALLSGKSAHHSAMASRENSTTSTAELVLLAKRMESETRYSCSFTDMNTDRPERF